MNKEEKQIEEIYRMLLNGCNGIECYECEGKDKRDGCLLYHNAYALYNAGYHKASEVVEEIADFIWEKDIADTLLPINGRYLSKQDFIAELKKKYTKGEDNEQRKAD